MRTNRFVSVLCPSRGRPEQLQASMASLYGTWKGQPGMEILVRCDTEDLALQEYEKRLAGAPACRLFVGPELKRYASMHEFYSELARAALGRWLVLWNDDCLMRTKGWDEYLDDLTEEHALVHTKDNISKGRWTAFPIVTRSLLGLQGGMLAYHCLVDSWLCRVFAGLVTEHRVGIEIEHKWDRQRFDRWSAKAKALKEHDPIIGIQAWRAKIKRRLKEMEHGEAGTARGHDVRGVEEDRGPGV